MSYKYTVLKDNPVSFFLLDEVESGSITNYSYLMSQYATYQDLKDNGVSYAALSGLPITDYSGNGMDGFSTNSSSFEVIPIIGAGVRGTEINEFAEISLKAPGMAIDRYPDNSFSMELWFKPSKSDFEEYPVVADSINNIGIFYNNENVIFRVSSTNYLQYKISRKQVIHVVGTFSKDKMSLYINGILVNEKTFTEKFKFSNESLNLNIGPANLNHKFFIDGISFYSYELEESKVYSHYVAGYKETKYSQIVYSQNGILFSLNSLTLKPAISYRYPGLNQLESFVAGDAYYDQTNSVITFEKTAAQESKLFTFEDRIYVPNPDIVESSLITYGQDVENVLVEVSVPGQPWVACKNNSPVPYYNKNENLASSILDIRVTMSTDDSSFDIPYFDRLEIDFYTDKDFYSDNSGNRIYSDYDYSLGQYNYPVRMQNEYNGISMLDGHGFSVDLSMNPKTIEMFFSSNGNSNVLFSSSSSEFGWDNNGDVYSSGIDSIYINGINRTSETNIFNVLLSDISNHVVLILDESASNIKFNQNQSDSISGGNNLYSNIAFYEDQFSSDQIINNYKLYCSDNMSSVEDPGLEISEDSQGTDNTAYYTRYFDDILTVY